MADTRNRGFTVEQHGMSNGRCPVAFCWWETKQPTELQVAEAILRHFTIAHDEPVDEEDR